MLTLWVLKTERNGPGTAGDRFFRLISDPREAVSLCEYLQGFLSLCLPGTDRHSQVLKCRCLRVLMLWCLLLPSSGGLPWRPLLCLCLKSALTDSFLLTLTQGALSKTSQKMARIFGSHTSCLCFCISLQIQGGQGGQPARNQGQERLPTV